MAVFDHPAFDGHEAVHFAHDADAGLSAIIAIHSTALGPAAGGCRMWNYASADAALNDVLRLARGMSYKNAMADLPLGGGKAVILGDAHHDKSPELFTAFGRAVDSLCGRYITAEDVGITVDDMAIVKRETPYVSGLPPAGGGAAGGDPSPKTARGLYYGIQAAAKARYGRDSLDGMTVAVQGLGSVGMHLCREMHAAGARLIVADIREASVEQARTAFGATLVDPGEIIGADADVLAPCALGGILNAESIPRIRAGIVAGGANNQLQRDEDGQRLHERGILYAPDYVINAGGIINVAAEYLKSMDERGVMDRLRAIGTRLSEIFDVAKREDRPTNVVADELAQARINAAKNR